MRTRNIKPDFFSDDELADIEPLGRLLFAGLWCAADREGRLKDRPKKLKAVLLPYDECSCDTLLDALQQREFIQRYTVNGCQYIQIVNFDKHQHPHVKEIPSTIPPPGEPGASPVQSLAFPETDPADLDPISRSRSRSRSKNSIMSTCVDRGQSKERIQKAEAVMAFLNEQTGKHYRFRSPRGKLTAGAKVILARIDDGFDDEVLTQVAALKTAEWRHTDMEKYLRPETLYGATKFSSYVGAVE